MAKTEIELTQWEEDLNRHAREIQERELAVSAAEKKQSEHGDVDRIDYLFDKVNRNRQHSVVLDQAPVIQIAPAGEDSVTRALCGFAAAASALTLIIVVAIVGIVLALA